jgi:hypothetical protein
MRPSTPLASSSGSGGILSKAGAAAKDKLAGRRETKRSYSSLAEQAQLHLAERARFAEAEGNTSDEGGLASPQDSSLDVAGEWDKEVWMGRVKRTEEREVETNGFGLHDEMDPEKAAALEAEEQQRALQAATTQADKERSARDKRAAGGTRLTMSSMSGYFQDRILTQSMMRAMAIL